MHKLISKYGSVAAVVARLNELESQQALAEEAGVSPYSVVRFMMAFGVARRTFYTLPDAALYQIKPELVAVVEAGK